MKTKIEQAEQLVRERVPELMELTFGCEGVTHGRTWVLTHAGWQCTSESGFSLIEPRKIIGHKPQLQHYLAVLDGKKSIAVTQTGQCIEPANTPNGTRPLNLRFNLKTGAPASEIDAEAFINLVTNHE